MPMHSTLAATSRAISHQKHMQGAHEVGKADARIEHIEARARDLAVAAALQAEDIAALTFMLKERDETLSHFVRRCLAAETRVIEQDAIIRGRNLPDPSAIHAVIQ